MTHGALPPPSTGFAPRAVPTDPPLNAINPDLRAPRAAPQAATNPDLAPADWKRFQGAPADSTVYRPGPSYGDVQSGKAEMSRGASGPGVTQVQAALRRTGEKIEVDGLYGPKTEEAVKRFQRAHDLPDTGVVDAATAKALDAAAPAPKPSPRPAPLPGPKPNGGGGGGGGGKVTPPTPPNVPKLPDNPYAAMGQVYDLATHNLQGYKKGSNPAFDAAVQKLLDQPPNKLNAGGDPEYGKMIEAESRFRAAAATAGF